jgi:hypothetical protein
MTRQMAGVERLEASELKDATLDRLAEVANVAQFVSFGPGSEPELRFARLRGGLAAERRTVEGAIEDLLARSPEGTVNVRSFLAEQPRSHDFLYGLAAVAEVAAAVHRFAGQGLVTIVNETIDVEDGGVSGVAFGGLIEVAPGDTPRAVEKPGIAAFSFELAVRLLTTVYGFAPDVPDDPGLRTEFSIHPLKRGLRNGHTVVWEEEAFEPIELPATVEWPNRFSRFLGDKAFGLLIADALGLPVPRTTVIPRGTAPFHFGRSTGSVECWTRTCPAEQTPGRFTTQRGWVDPFALLASEDPARQVASVLAQEGVEAAFSGAAVSTADGALIVEGVAGTGEAFMQGEVEPGPLPTQVERDVHALSRQAEQSLGPVRFEWAHDGERAWILQLHRGAALSAGRTIFPGTPAREHRLRVDEGIEALRALADQLAGTEDGVILVGNAGVTSHLGDILRQARIPSRIEPDV